MSFVDHFKSLSAKFKSKKQDGIHCLSQEWDGGTPAAPIVLGTIGGLRPSTAIAMVMQMPPEEGELTTKLFGGDQSRTQELLDAMQAENPAVKSAGKNENWDRKAP